MDEKPIAFAHCQLRHDYVEGTESSPVGYLEGIFVEEAYRRKGFAADLLAECERWAREKGCSEFASDCELDNEESLKFCLAFTVEDVEKEYEKVLALGARIIEPPAKRPWGAVNMSFYDPDNNIVFLRQFVQIDNTAEIKAENVG